jgi:hypothetical protein
MSGRKNRSKKSAAAAAQGQSKLTFGLTGAITFGTDDARKAKRPKVRSAEQISQGVNASSNMRGMSVTGSTVPGSLPALNDELVSARDDKVPLAENGAQTRDLRCFDVVPR